MIKELSPSFLGKCYSCHKETEIVTCISWRTQLGSDSKRVFGSFRNFCKQCGKDLGIKINRDITVKDLKDLKDKTNLGKYYRCEKCRMFFPRKEVYQKICLICYGRMRDDRN